ncbi:ZIP family metal transporter [Paenibacillus hemerocallicola]|uniref:ZIP family metal transporter n=1 Tax=Paenibacillus hemerocallicola TaxID=1172614 RepID=A0A5C4SX64_9BACL|nr:ZIP family metal transporter [Paenibacillus hemerocallicola]TNJ59625.1 ZIP family metal transporter [Paenibacillus hemerocallicola]
MNTFLLLAACSSLCTLIGALPSLFLRDISHRGKDVLLAYTAGIMVAASTYGLLPSALKLSNMYVLTVGILLGAMLLTVMELYIPHADPSHSNTRSDERHSLLLIAMLLHNLPEGFSTGISLASGDTDMGTLVATAIGLQNIPEGFLVSLFLVTRRTGMGKTFLYSSAIAATEWATACLGYYFGTELRLLIPYGLAFAGGAMLYVVYKELIPESHGDGHEIPATFAFIIGTLTMIGLVEWLG